MSAAGAAEERHARAALARLAEPGDARLGARIAALGAGEVLRLVREDRLSGQEVAHYRARLIGLDVEADLRSAERAGARLLVPGDDEWPAAVDDLGPAAPLVLWVRGAGDLADVVRRAVAVVGARACTPYGEHMAADLAAGLGERGWTTVSGGAFGIDAAAHRGAMAVNAGTVAVLACGVDVAYPAGHDLLLARIAEQGVVMSELPPGSRPTKSRFLKRNRVIAALGRGTVVVEAAVRSGALNTAGHAASLGRSVLAVPGPVTSMVSAGCHELVRTQNAALVTDAADVLDIVGRLGVDESPPRRGEVAPHDHLDPLQLRVLDGLPARRWAPPDNVSRVAGVDPGTLLRALATLRAMGLAECADGRWRRTRREGT